MALILTILIFLTVVLVVFSFGAAAYAPSSVIGSRLRSLGSQQREQLQKDKPVMKERLEQALDPLSKALPMSPDEVSRTRGWLIEAGYRESRHLTIYLGIRVLCAALGLGLVLLISGVNNAPFLVGGPALGFFLPRFFLK